jgi:precorrin-4 methylase
MQVKNMLLYLVTVVVLAVSVNVRADQKSLSITGLVKQPLILSLEDLGKFQPVTVRINEIRKNGAYHGAFTTQGIPLRNLLEIAGIAKDESGFRKPQDLAIVIRDGFGKKVALSWGEIFYRNPAEVSIALSATPVMPLKDCAKCHTADFYQPHLDQLNRRISFPKLVVAHDSYADRTLEGVVNIEVVDLGTGKKPAKMKELYSPSVSFSSAGHIYQTYADLPAFQRTSIKVAVIGEGKGFHGQVEYEGAPLADLIEKTGIKPDVDTVFVVSAPDGYRSLLSYGELFLSPQGKRIIIADRQNGKKIEKSGKFVLILPDDLSADREVKSIANIEVVSLRQPAKLYIIGMGPGDTDLMTSEALTYLAKADVLVSPEDISTRFAPYLSGKPVLFDPMFHLKKQSHVHSHPEMTEQQHKKINSDEEKAAIQKIRGALAQGKNVAFLDWGDPLVFGSSSWVRKYFNEDEYHIVPSISAFNVANAVIAREVTCEGSVIMTSPAGLRNNEALLDAAAKKGDTVSVFMGLKEFRELMPLLKKHYQDATPVVIVYNAGISGVEHKISGALSDILAKTEQEQERHLGMIYIGPCLAGSRF